MDRVRSREGSMRRRRVIRQLSPAGRRSRLKARTALAALLTCSMLAVGAGSASAVIVHLQNGKALSYQPLRGVAPLTTLDEYFSNLDYTAAR